MLFALGAAVAVTFDGNWLRVMQETIQQSGSHGGLPYFEWMRNQLNDSADVILIDSRTGVTEMGGVCTRQLADVVVCFCAPNFQNLNGLVRMVTSFKRPEITKLRGREVEVVVVPSRLDNGETGLQNAFEKEFVQTLGEVPAVFQRRKASFWDLRIPYVPMYAYREKLAIGEPDRNRDLEAAYINLALHLATLAPDGSAIRTHCDLQSKLSRLRKALVLVAIRSRNRDVLWDQVFEWIDRQPDIGCHLLEEKENFIDKYHANAPCHGFLIVCDRSALEDQRYSLDKDIEDCSLIQRRENDESRLPPVGLVYFPPPPPQWSRLQRMTPQRLHRISGDTPDTLGQFFEDVRYIAKFSAAPSPFGL